MPVLFSAHLGEGGEVGVRPQLGLSMAGIVEHVGEHLFACELIFMRGEF